SWRALEQATGKNKILGRRARYGRRQLYDWQTGRVPGIQLGTTFGRGAIASLYLRYEWQHSPHVSDCDATEPWRQPSHAARQPSADAEPNVVYQFDQLDRLQPGGRITRQAELPVVPFGVIYDRLHRLVGQQCGPRAQHDQLDVA